MGFHNVWAFCYIDCHNRTSYRELFRTVGTQSYKSHVVDDRVKHKRDGMAPFIAVVRCPSTTKLPSGITTRRERET